MSANLAVNDQAFHDDKQLIADLSALNGLISRYVLQHLDADAGRVRPPSPADEQILVAAMTTLASRVQARTERQATSPRPARLEGDHVPQQLTYSRPPER